MTFDKSPVVMYCPECGAVCTEVLSTPLCEYVVHTCEDCKNVPNDNLSWLAMRESHSSNGECSKCHSKNQPLHYGVCGCRVLDRLTDSGFAISRWKTFIIKAIEQGSSYPNVKQIKSVFPNAEDWLCKETYYDLAYIRKRIKHANRLKVKK